MRLTVLLAIIPALFALRAIVKTRHSRKRKISPVHERILVLGASSGIGKSIAHEYAKRGARVCIVARRAEKVEETIRACQAERGSEDGVLGCVADFTNVEDMVRVRTLITQGLVNTQLETCSYSLTYNKRVAWVRYSHCCRWCLLTQASPGDRWSRPYPKARISSSSGEYRGHTKGRRRYCSSHKGKLHRASHCCCVFCKLQTCRWVAGPLIFVDSYVDPNISSSFNFARIFPGCSYPSTHSSIVRFNKGCFPPSLPVTRHRTSWHKVFTGYAFNG